MHRRFLSTVVIVFCFAISFGQVKVAIEIPDTIKAFRFAKVTQTEEDYDTKELKTVATMVYGFDERKNIIYTFDEKGLYYAYEYDSLNNLVTEYFYEELDQAGKRIPSAKWNYIYIDGRRERIDRYIYKNGSWQFVETVRNTYLVDKHGRIVQNDYYDANNQLKTSTSYSYDSKGPEVKDFNSGWFRSHYFREVDKDATGKTIEITNYIYDQYGRCIGKVREDLSDKRVKRVQNTEFTYSPDGLLLEETEYFNDETDYSFKRICQYDEKGFVTKYTSSRFGEFGSVKVYEYFEP